MGIALSYTETDTSYQFVFENGKEVLLPKSFVIIVDDGTSLLSVKTTGSRKTLFLIRKSENNR